jgi:RHS repeat-associated protein
LIETTNGAGEKQFFKRDALGRLLHRRLSSGETQSYEYDALGNVLAGRAGEHLVEFVRDELARITTEKQGEQWVKSEYDGLGNVTRLQSSLGADVAFGFDHDSRLRRVTANGHLVCNVTRDARGLDVLRELPAGLRLEQSFDSRGLLRSQQLDGRPGAAAPILQREYRFDPRALLREINDLQFGIVRYDYDPMERIARISGDQFEESLLYDKAGNVEQTEWQEGSRSDVTHRVLGKGNRLLRAGEVTYDYDGNGRLAKKQEAPSPDAAARVWHYRWNALNQLVGLTTPDGAEWRYSYDAFGRRIGKSGPDRTLRYIWNKHYLLHEIDDSVAAHRAWVFEPDSFRPVAQITNGVVQSIVTDHLGTPTELVNQFGQVTRLRNAYHKAGHGIAKARVADCPLGFEGQFHDEESGLFYNRFRYFDPALSRFISPDPKSVLGGLNLYLYCPNPLRSTDPLGLDSRALDRALGGTVGDGDQAHHIIPEQVMNQNADMIRQAESMGFQRDGAGNGILLPSDDARATALGLPSHRGSHPQYNALVNADVAAIRADWKAGNITDQEMLAQLGAVQAKWRKKIDDNDPSLPRGKTSACKLG